MLCINCEVLSTKFFAPLFFVSQQLDLLVCFSKITYVWLDMRNTRIQNRKKKNSSEAFSEFFLLQFLLESVKLVKYGDYSSQTLKLQSSKSWWETQSTQYEISGRININTRNVVSEYGTGWGNGMRQMGQIMKNQTRKKKWQFCLIFLRSILAAICLMAIKRSTSLVAV